MRLEFLYPAWFVLCASIGAFLGNATGYGALRGLSDGVIVATMPIFLLMAALGVISLWRPLLPPCRCGKCRQRNYRLAERAGDARPATRYRCPECGRVYESSKGSFDEVTEDGCIIPYMHHSKWGRWRKHAAGPDSA